MSKFIVQNVRPIALIVFCTVAGAMFGVPWIGLGAGVLIVALATLFL